MSKYKQIEMFTERDIKRVEPDRPEREKTTHLKKYIDKHVEIENKASLHRYRGIYGTSVQPGCFCLWFDNDNS